MRHFNPTSLVKPKNYQSFQFSESFFQENKVDLEIGSGVGWHAITYSKCNPERHLIAVERTEVKFNKFKNRLEHHQGFKNLTPIHADIVPWTVHFLPDSSIEKIFIFYPNPYPKNPSARFFKMPFFEYLLKKGKENLTIHLATNEFNYQQEARELSESTWKLELIQFQELTLKSSFNPRTHFEKKYLLRNETCYDLIFQRTKQK